MQLISGFSKLSKNDKISLLQKMYLNEDKSAGKLLESFWHQDTKLQKVIDEFSENTLTNFIFPYGVVPNLLLNDSLYCVPMVIEESSVVAAASKACKFWYERGGFKTTIKGLEKIGQVHFIWNGKSENLFSFFEKEKESFLEEVSPLLTNMEKRGGGLKSLELIDRTADEKGYYQLKGVFETCDAMGANFINTVLESLGQILKFKIENSENLNDEDKDVQIVMCILSNYTPNCLVKAQVECPIEDLYDPAHGMSGEEFAEKFARAIRIAKIDVTRATTHNKGIFNGIDGVILATGNDFRATSACGHTHAARSGQYRSLSDCSVENGIFKFWLEIPLALGTVGGLTGLHPMAKFSLDLLGKPSAARLMEITASIGLAQNFAAIRSLITSGIQKGHMKMHLMNILNHLEATNDEREEIKKLFENQVVSFNSVREQLSKFRNYQ